VNTEGFEKLKAYTDTLLYLLINAYARLLFLRPMMVNETLISRVDAEGGQQGFQQLRNILYWDFINELVKICDDKGDRTPSIRRLTKDIEDPSLRNLLEEKYMAVRSGFDDENEWKIEYRKILDRIGENTEKLLISTAYPGYKTIRDSLIAHTDLRKTGSEYLRLNIQPLGLKHGDELEVLNLVTTIVDDLNLAIRSASFSWSLFLEPEVKTVCKFWKIAQIEPNGSDKQYPWTPFGALRKNGSF